MEIVRSNHNILEKIFTASKTSCLLKYRAVCKLWAEEAARILRKRKVMIAFRSVEDIEEFITISRPTPLTFLNYTIDIPSMNEMREDSWKEMHPTIVDLLECYKDDIWELKFWYQPLTTISENVELQSSNADSIVEDNVNDDELLIQNFSSLTKLQLLSNYVQSLNSPQRDSIEHRMPKYFASLSAPNLRSLTIQHLHETECSDTVRNIIKSCQNHLEYLKIPAKPFPSVALDNSTLLENLSELDLLGIFHGFSCSTNETLEAIMKGCPRLQKLGIEFSFRTSLVKIQEMLHILSKTLIELRCTIQDRNLLARQITRVDFLFPEMTKLQTLQMRWSNPGFVYYIDKLPVLKELYLDSVWTRKVPGSVYPSGQLFQEGMADFKQLTCLKLTEALNIEQVSTFSQYFPNLTVLGCSFDSDESLRIVYKNMRSLKCLIIERKSNITEVGGICGLQINGENSSEISEVSGDMNELLPNIGDMKELESLEMCQLGATFQSLRYGVMKLKKLKTLVIQSTVFKSLTMDNNHDDATLECASLAEVANKMKQLRKLKLWIRHSSERPSIEEMARLEKELYFLNELSVVNHSLCGI